MNNNNNNDLILPVKSYGNAKLLKEMVLKDNSGQSGIYRWLNNLNKKTYVGSGVNLAKRLGSYYNENELKRNSRPIKDAGPAFLSPHLTTYGVRCGERKGGQIKYGHENFTLEILEYCPETKLLEREQRGGGGG